MGQFWRGPVLLRAASAEALRGERRASVSLFPEEVPR